MRTALAILAMGMVLMAPSATAASQDLRAPSNVVAYRMADGHAFLTWAPGVGAIDYIVYRGTQPDRLTQVHEGRAPAFYDADAPPAGTSVFYIVSAISLDGSTHSTNLTTTPSGDCVATSQNPPAPGSYSVALRHCMDMIPEL